MKDTLIFDVRQIHDGHFNVYDVEVPTSFLDLNFEDTRFITAVSGTVTLLRYSEDNVYVKADITAGIEMQCGKCLAPFKTDINATFELQFCPETGDKTVASEGAEGGERYYDGQTFDISDDARQALVVQVPIWPLCGQTCEGLCAGCGVNLNDAVCTCPNSDNAVPDVPNIQSPFAGLSQMLAETRLENESEPENRNKEVAPRNGTPKT